MKIRNKLVVTVGAVVALVGACTSSDTRCPVSKGETCPSKAETSSPATPAFPRVAMLQQLERPGDWESRRASSTDPDWKHGNIDARALPPGKTLTMAELDGPGRITHIWMTIAPNVKNYSRYLTLRMYWDGREEPAVEAPVGDFFAVGHGVDRTVHSLPIQVSSEGRARNSYWPMPFRKSARITITNDSDQHVESVYWYIDWQKLPSLPEDTMYFHAQYRQEYPAKAGQNYLIFDGEGDGIYVGTVYSGQMREKSWFGEGDDFFYIDGAEEPQLKGTGTEDYFNDAWGFREIEHPFYGITLWEGYEPGDRGTVYRWHIPDPIRFHKSLKFTIEHMGILFDKEGKLKSAFGERRDHLSSVAYWYQRGPAKRFASMPPVEERIVTGTVMEGEHMLSEGQVKATPVDPQVQKGGAWSGHAQLLFTPNTEDASIEFTFDISEANRYAFNANLTRSFDYGIYDVYLDGEKIESGLDLYNPSVTVSSTSLGSHEMEAGTHTLRFECVGSNPRSEIGKTGQPGYYFGLDSLQYLDVMERE